MVRGMQRNPEDRYSSADEMRRELNAIVADGAGAQTSILERVSKTAVMPAIVPAVALASGAEVATDGFGEPRPARRFAWLWVALAGVLVVAGLGMAARQSREGDGAGDGSGSGVSTSGAASTSASVAVQSSPVVPVQPEMATVPDIVGMASAVASSALEAAGFRAQALPAEYNPDIPVDQVYAQSPEARQTAALSSVVRYAVSRGPDPTLGGWKNGRQKPGKDGNRDN